jgi:hypothetical protein
MWIAAEAVATKTFYISLNRKHINESFSNDLVEFYDNLYENHFNLVIKNSFPISGKL